MQKQLQPWITVASILRVKRSVWANQDRSWQEASVRGLKVGETTLDVEITGGWTAAGGERHATIRNSGGPPVTVDYLADVPLGAAFMDFSIAGAEWVDAPGEPGAPGAAMPPPRVRLAEGDAAVVTTRWQGGLAVAPPRIDLEPGQRSTGLRVIDFERDGEGWLLTIEGTAGREYLVDLYGTAVQAMVTGDGAAVAPAQPTTDAARAAMGGGRFMVAFSGGEARVGEARRTVTLRLVPAGP